MTRRRLAFTLVELLVVIAILALLISILIPALSRARGGARTVVCLTNLRELSTGWQMYADEHGDVMVPGRMFKRTGGTANPDNWYDIGNGTKYRPRWATTMGVQVGLVAFNDPISFEDAKGDPGLAALVDRQDYDGKVYLCTEAAERTDERNSAYGYNYQFLGNARLAGGRFVNFPVLRSRLARVSGTVMAADCMGTAAGLNRQSRGAYRNDGTDFAEVGNHGWTLDPPRLAVTSDHGSGDFGSPRTAVDPRHRGRANTLFADSHGEALSDTALGYRRHDDGRYVDLDPFADPEGLGPPHNRLFDGTGRDDLPPGI